MIKSFGDRQTEKLFKQRKTKRFSRDLGEKALRKLFLLHNAKSIQDLQVNPGNHYEQLKGDRKKESSIKINDQWRLVFEWIDGNAYKVMIEDYH